MSSAAFAVFERLLEHVDSVRVAAAREARAGFPDAVPVLLRSGFVLTVAALDTYIHETGVRLLVDRAQAGHPEAAQVSSYLGKLSASDVSGPSAEGLIRLRLSYKTLVAPDKIKELLTTAGLDSEDIWLRAAISMGSRPDRVELQTRLQYDRRNQIAHEGDWDSIALDFRPFEDAHLTDCSNCIRGLVGALDSLL